MTRTRLTEMGGVERTRKTATKTGVKKPAILTKKKMGGRWERTRIRKAIQKE